MADLTSKTTTAATPNLPKADTIRGASNEPLVFMQTIAGFNTNPGRITSIDHGSGNPNAWKIGPNQHLTLRMNGNGVLAGPEVDGITNATGERSLGRVSVIVSPTNITETGPFNVTDSRLASYGARNALLTHVSGDQINIITPELPPTSKMIDANIGSVFVHVVVKNPTTGVNTVYPGEQRLMAKVAQYDAVPLTAEKIGAPPAPEAGTEADPHSDQRPFAKPVVPKMLTAHVSHADGKLVTPSDPAGPGEMVTMYAVGLPSATDNVSVRLLSAPGTPTGKNYTFVTPSKIEETEAGSKVYKISFILPEATALKERGLLLPDGRGVTDSSTYDESFAKRAVKNWNQERPDAGSPAAGTGVIIALDERGARDDQASIKQSQYFFIPASPGAAR